MFDELKKETEDNMAKLDKDFDTILNIYNKVKGMVPTEDLNQLKDQLAQNARLRQGTAKFASWLDKAELIIRKIEHWLNQK